MVFVLISWWLLTLAFLEDAHSYLLLLLALMHRWFIVLSFLSFGHDLHV